MPCARHLLLRAQALPASQAYTAPSRSLVKVTVKHAPGGGVLRAAEVEARLHATRPSTASLGLVGVPPWLVPNRVSR
jgi:hypothetical protein